MTSERRWLANRENARLSTGPRTAEGRAVAAGNGVRHGLTSRVPVVPGIEDPAEWAAHREGLLAALGPVGRLEEALAERVASVLWRLERVTRAEREAIALRQESVEEDISESEENMAELRRGLRGTGLDLPPPKPGEHEKRVERAHRSRLLPREDEVVLLARYEAHLSRQLSQALHELQRLQAGRGAGMAGVAPPAAVDVTLVGAV